MFTEMFRCYRTLDFPPGAIYAALQKIIELFSIQIKPKIELEYQTFELFQKKDVELSDLVSIVSFSQELTSLRFIAFSLEKKPFSDHRVIFSKKNGLLEIRAYSFVTEELPELFKTIETSLSIGNSRVHSSILDPVKEQRENFYYLKTTSDIIGQICNGFNLFARKLMQRYNGRPPYEITDEYDVQNLFHAILLLHFKDVRPEEYTPSYAGGSSRIDFLLPEAATVIEIKKTRDSLKERKIGEELLVDISRYKSHPQCKRLVCFVFDPDGYISNPIGLERDLAREEESFSVKVFVRPQGY